MSAAAAARGMIADIQGGIGEAMPFESGRFDTVVTTFTLCSVDDQMRVLKEIKRVLKPGGRLPQIDAGPDHLRELRAIIYPTLKPERPADACDPAGFTRLADETLRYPIELTSADRS